MNLFRLIKISLSNLYANKLRSALTMLGIVIGVSSIITMVALGEGNKAQIVSEIEKIGADVILILPHQQAYYGPSLEYAGLKFKDLEAILRQCPAIRAATPTHQYQAAIKYEDKQDYILATGTTPQSFIAQNINLLRGRFISDLDMARGEPVGVIEETEVVQKLFGVEDPLGKEISLRGQKIKIVGVAEKKKDALRLLNPEMLPFPDKLFLPLSAHQKIFGAKDFFLQTYVRAKDSSKVEEGIAQIKEVLTQRYGNIDKRYRIQKITELLESKERIANLMTLVGAAIAAVALLVGGIGVMNIMLVSVTERTREIGISKALGAKTRDILWQFLAEATGLSLMGGLLGIGVGIILAKLISPLVNIPAVIPWPAVVIGFLVSVLTGIFSGVYPARRAARLDPIEALRYV